MFSCVSITGNAVEGSDEPKAGAVVVLGSFRAPHSPVPTTVQLTQNDQLCHCCSSELGRTSR